MKMYKVTDRYDGTDVLGGPVSGNNVYITAYPKPEPGYKHPRDLAVNESARCVYNLSGTRGVYLVTRIDDAPEAA